MMARTICNVNGVNAAARILSVASEIAEVREFACSTPCYRKQRNYHRKAVFMRGDRKSFPFNISKLGSGLIALSCISLLLLGAKAADRNESTVIRAGAVEAQDFLLKNEDGRVYARLCLEPRQEVDETGWPRLYDSEPRNSGSGCVGVLR
jgi:hypothetical protein